MRSLIEKLSSNPLGVVTVIVGWLLCSLLFCIAIGLSAKGN
jgi:hypothetical protein